MLNRTVSGSSPRSTRRTSANPIIPFEASSSILTALIIAAIAFLASCALAITIGSTKLAGAWTSGLGASATIRISALEPELEERTRTAIRLIGDTEGVRDVRLLGREELQELLRPWFGQNAELADMPMPRILAVSVDKDAPPDPELVQARLAGAQLHAVYDAHERWRSRAAEAAKSLRAIAIGALIVVTIAVLAVIFAAVRAGLLAQQDVVAALRMAGAEDRFVAGVFQRRFAFLGLVGASVGCAVAVLVFVLFGAVSRLAGLLPGLSLPRGWLLVVLAIILLISLVSVLVARITVLTALKNHA